MNIWVFLSVISVLALSYCWIGVRVSKGLRSRSDYFLGGRALGLVALSLSVMATQLGGGIVLGAADEGYRIGWFALFWPGGIALGLLALGFGLGKRLRQMGVATVAELFGTVYGSRLLRWVASGLSIISLFLLLVAQLIGCRELLTAFGMQSDVLFIALWLGVLLYTVVGGLKAVVYTDVIQTLFLLLVFSLAFGAARFSTATFEMGAACFEKMGKGGALFSTLFLMPFLFMLIGQDMGQRCFAAKSDRAVSRAFFFAVIGFCVIGAIPVAFGVWARSAGLEPLPGASVLMTAVSALTHPVVATLIACGALVAILSTVDSLLCAVSSNLACDFGDRLGLRACQLATLGVGLFAIVLSMTCGSVSGITMLSYELSVCCLAVPVLASLWRRRSTPLAGALALVGGLAGFLLFRWVELPIPKEVASLLLSLVGYTVGTRVRILVERRTT